MQSFAPRPIVFLGLQKIGEWTLKAYSVTYGGQTFDWSRFAPCLKYVEAELPEPDFERGRPGMGFLIAHQGLTGDYMVLGWWDNENELPIRVWVRRGKNETWRLAIGGESVCVWDLEIIWTEREAWVISMMTEAPNPEKYLAAVNEKFRTQ